MKKHVLKLLVKEVLQEVEQSRWSSSDRDTNRYVVKFLDPLLHGRNKQNFVSWGISDIDTSMVELNLYFKMLKPDDVSIIFTLVRRISGDLLVIEKTISLKQEYDSIKTI